VAKYNDFAYGSGTKYGTDAPVETSDPTSKSVWILTVDWNNDGSFDGTNEAQWMSNIPSFRRGHNFYVAQDGNGFEGFQPGKAILQMDNEDRRYDPYNASSPLYPNVVPGRKVQISVKEVATGRVDVVMTGFIENIRPANDESKQVYIDVVDGLKSLNEGEFTVATPVYRTNISDCIQSVLDLSDWSGPRAIDSDSQPVVRWAPESANPMQTLRGLSNACLGNIFVDKLGKINFYSRSHNSQPTHTLGQADVLKNIQVSMPWENVRNAVTCIANKPMKGELKDIVALPSPFRIVIPSSTWRSVTLDLDGEYIDVQFFGITANTDSGGGGIDITNVVDYTYSIGAKSVTFSFSTPVNGYVTSISLKGREYIPKQVKFNASDTVSRAAYGNRRFILDSEWLQNINHAEAFVTIIKNALKDPSKAPRLVLQGRPDIQYMFDLLNKVTFTSATLDISATFYVGSIEFRWLKAGGQSVQTILTLQPLIYDTSTIADDPYDPGLPEVPTVPGTGPGTGNIPPPSEVILDCIADANAAQNGPYTMFSDGYFELLSTSSVQQKLNIPFPCVVRMGTASYPTYVSLYVSRQIYVDGVWYLTQSETFYEVWAIDSTGAPLFKADSVITQGDYITATFHPSVGTVVGGFRVVMVRSPEYDFLNGHTFDFSNGSQGWRPANQDAGYPRGDIFLPASARPAWNALYWSWIGNLKIIPNPLNESLGGADYQNVWALFPSQKIYGKAGATMTADAVNVNDTPGFQAIGILYTDNSWDFKEAPGVGKIAVCSAPNYGKEVKAFQFHVNSAQYNGIFYIDNCTIEGFDLAPADSMKLIVKSAFVSNICAIP